MKLFVEHKNVWGFLYADHFNSTLQIKLWKKHTLKGFFLKKNYCYFSSFSFFCSRRLQNILNQCIVRCWGYPYEAGTGWRETDFVITWLWDGRYWEMFHSSHKNKRSSWLHRGGNIWLNVKKARIYWVPCG